MDKDIKSLVTLDVYKHKIRMAVAEAGSQAPT